MFLAALTLACGTGTATPPDSGDTTAPIAADLVLWNVTTVDGERRTEGVAVYVADGRIAAIEPAIGEAPANAVDGTGRFVVPGLVDAHVHLALGGSTELVGDTLAANLRAQLTAGVTEVVDLGGPESLFDLRDQLEASHAPAPHIRASGPFLTAAGSHPCESAPDPDGCLFVDDAAAGLATATALRTDGADLIKVAVADAGFSDWGPTPRLNLDALDGIVSAGAPVWAHIDTQTDLVDALAHGVTVLAHPPFDAPLDPDGLAAAGSAQAVITTVSAFAGVGRLLDGTLDPDDPTLGLTPAQRVSWARIGTHPDVLLPGWAEANAEWATNARTNLAALDAAGVLVVPGSDAGYLFVPHGRGLHDELRELVAIGLSPREALGRATLSAHTLLDEPGGRAALGEPADLLLLRSDPDLSVDALDDIDTIVLGGALWTPESVAAADLLPDGAAEAGDACVEHADCVSGGCDGLSHECAAACDVATTVEDPICGRDAWCMASDAVSDPQGVCRAEATCSLYAQDCGSVAYDRACIPYDEDTNACWYAGPRRAGQSCDESSASTACAAGLSCSPIDARCYTLCDPGGADSCGGGLHCTTVETSVGAPWFGLCL